MPARLSEIGAALRQLEIGAKLRDGGGKHNWFVDSPGRRPYTIPAHNGLKTEIEDKYINALCRHLGVDRGDFWRILRA
jgi:hypothetical protein